MSRHWNFDVATLPQCRDISRMLILMSLFIIAMSRCHYIREVFRVDVATLRKSFLLFEMFLLVYSILFMQIQFMLVNISLSILRNLNSSTNSNTKILNSVNSAYIHCIVDYYPNSAVSHP